MEDDGARRVAAAGRAICKWMMKEMKRGREDAAAAAAAVVGIRNRKEEAGSRSIGNAGLESRLRPLRIMIY